MDEKIDDASPAEQPRTVSGIDSASGGGGVVSKHIDLTEHLRHVRAESTEKINMLRELLSFCQHPIIAAMADANRHGDENESGQLANLLRKIEWALRETGE